MHPCTHLEAWEYQTVGNSKPFLMFVKQKISLQFIQNWKKRIDNSRRAYLYKNNIFIKNFMYHPYLQAVNISKYRINLSQFHMSSHRLCIETGRWHRPIQTPISERICHVCTTLEDEYHFVLECSLYLNLRKKFIPPYYWKKPSVFKFIDLLSSNNVCLFQKLGCYINYAFKIRCDTL